MLRVRSRHRLFTMSGCARKPLSHLTQDGWKAPRAGQETGKLHAASTPLCEGRRISAGVETFRPVLVASFLAKVVFGKRGWCADPRHSIDAQCRR